MVFLLLNCMSSLYILDIEALIKYMVCKYLLHCIGSLFVDCFLCYTKVSYFNIVPLVNFCFVPYALVVISKKLLQDQCQEVFPFVLFSFRSISVSGLIFRSIIHLEVFCEQCKLGVQFYSFACRYPVFPTIMCSWHFCQKE